METLRSTTVSTKQQRIAQLAREAPEMAFTTLAHHIDLDWMLEAFRRRRQGASTGGGHGAGIDIRKFFDTLDHAHLRAILRRRIRDGVLERLIGKWLNAGVMEAGKLSYPQG